jgi:hypothetical protein
MVRLDHRRLVENMFESKPKGKRRMGKPRMRWLEGVEKDIRERKVERWRQRQ